MWLVAAARADVVTVKNGDTVTGRVVGMSDGSVRVKTAYMGEVSIKLEQVVSIKTDEGLGLNTTTGLRLTGPLSYDSGTGATIETVEGPVTVESTDVASVTALATSAEGASGPPPWKGTVELGLNGQSGNANTTNGNFGIGARREYDGNIAEAKASARYATDSGERTASEQRVTGRHEKLLDKHYFWYEALDLERDESEDLALRSTATTGPGRIWWREENNWLKTSIGAGVTHEIFEGSPSRTFPVGEVTNDYSKALSAKVTFTNVTKLAFSLSNTGSFRAENDAALTFPLNAKGKWDMKLGLNNQYERNPQPGIKSLDTYYYVNAVRNF